MWSPPFDLRSLCSFPSVPSLALSCFFGPSLHGRYPASWLLWPLLIPLPLSRKRPPQVRCQNLSPRAVRLYPVRLGDFWASLFPASLPPALGLTAGSCSYGRWFAIRCFQLRLAATPCRFRYGCRHRLRLAPFIQRDSAHAGHTGADPLVCAGRPRPALRPQNQGAARDEGRRGRPPHAVRWFSC